MSNPPEGLGARVAQVRGRTGLSKRKFASEIGISHSFLAAVEKETSTPSAATVLALVERFHIDPYWLLTGDEAPPPSPTPPTPPAPLAPRAPPTSPIGGESRAGPDEASEIGPRIRKLREDLGLSGRKFASALGVSNSYLSTLEKGRSSPGADVLRAIGEVFEVDLHWLLTGEGREVHGVVEAEASADMGPAPGERAALPRLDNIADVADGAGLEDAPDAGPAHFRHRRSRLLLDRLYQSGLEEEQIAVEAMLEALRLAAEARRSRPDSRSWGGSGPSATYLQDAPTMAQGYGTRSRLGNDGE